MTDKSNTFSVSPALGGSLPGTGSNHQDPGQATQRAITASPFGRMAMMGRLAGGIFGGMLSEGAKQLAQGQRPSVNDLLLTPQNARRLAGRLSEMRGAAMKVGQLLSMDSGHLLPQEFSEVLARLRDDAHYMPLGQIGVVLNEAWGSGWQSQFERFFFNPIAAASIGQVHEALLRDGRHLAVKIQYPGIRRSIDSDVDNVKRLLRLFNLLPQAMDFEPLLDEAKTQLHAEADYETEMAAMNRYASHLADDQRFEIPEVIESLTTTEVLTMSYLNGQPIEALADLPAEERNRVAASLMELALREVFEWGLVQTDPNFANYLYNNDTGRIQLLDFGATRSYSATRREALRCLLGACVDSNDEDIGRFATQVGYLGENDALEYRNKVINLLRTVTEPCRDRGCYDFGRSDIAERMSNILIEMRLNNQYGEMPPPDILFLHRKLGGLYLLLSRLRANIPVRRLIVGHPLFLVQNSERYIAQE